MCWNNGHFQSYLPEGTYGKENKLCHVYSVCFGCDNCGTCQSDDEAFAQPTNMVISTVVTEGSVCSAHFV